MSSGSPNKTAIPLAAFLFFGMVALYLWQHQNSHDRELVLRHTETSVEQVRIRVEGLMKARLASLALMADRWVERQPPDFSRQRFQGFATSLSKNYPGYSAIFWIDPSGAVRWVFPRDAQVSDIAMGLAGCAGHTADSDGLNTGTEVVVTPCVLSHREIGNANFHAVRALIYKNDLQGYLGGYFSVDQIMALCLTKEVLKDYDISVSEQDRTIYRHGDTGLTGEARPGESPRKAPYAVREIRFGGKLWTIMLAPDQASYSEGTNKNLAVLVFGLTVAAVLSLLLHLLIKRMKMYKASRDQAVLEIDERKQVQSALRENERKLKALLEELTSKNAELESFVYTVSHDLKTPIVTIEGFIGALREDFGDSITAVGDQYLHHMSSAARKMELLINELLNYSRIGRLEDKKTVFSMDLPIQEAMAILRPQVEARGIRVNVQENLPPVRADRKRMEQVVYNLLSNAVKYIGRDNAEPRIDVGCTQQEEGNVFWVRDNGMGIDRKYFDKIFQIFERLPAAKAADEGTGIGLAIVKRIIEHHGGRIWPDSQLGKGTTFYFTLKDKETQ